MAYITLDDGIRYAILQKRGEFNHETMSPESWPGACQPTMHGDVMEGEDPEDAFDREFFEKLGIGFSLLGYPRSRVEKKAPEDISGEDSLDYVSRVTSRFLPDIRLIFSTGGMRLINERQALEIGLTEITTLAKDRAVPQNILAMSEHDYRLLIWGFDFFRQYK